MKNPDCKLRQAVLRLTAQRGLARSGCIVWLQGGRLVDPGEARGAVRLKLRRESGQRRECEPPPAG